MASNLSRSVQQPVWNGMKICKASTSRHTFATSTSQYSEDSTPTSSTSSMQQTQAEITPPRYVGDARASEGRRSNRSSNVLSSFKEWIEGEGNKYKDVPRGLGPFWISDTPFPLNPSFDPSPPIAQSQKRALWKLHQSDPANTIRVLSGKYGISMERLRAILRLQALETEWTRKGKALQEPFQEGMDRVLGAVERPQGAALDEQVATEGNISTPRAATFEEFPMRSTEKDDASILAKALKAESLERGERRRTLPTGGPASKGPRPTITHIQGASGRASTTIVDMSKRPSSYVGGGVIARNQQQAEKRKQQRMRAAERKETLGRKRQRAARAMRSEKEESNILSSKMGKADSETIQSDV